MSQMPITQIITKCGGARQLSVALGLTRAAVYAWKRVPVAHVKTVAKLASVDKARIRADVYGDSK